MNRHFLSFFFSSTMFLLFFVTLNANAMSTNQNANKASDKFIINKKEILDSGLKTVYELLKTQKNVQFGMDGVINVSGYQGSAKVLINSVTASIENNPLSLGLQFVERIEISSEGNDSSPNINVISKKSTNSSDRSTCLKKCSLSGVSEADCNYICKAK